MPGGGQNPLPPACALRMRGCVMFSDVMYVCVYVCLSVGMKV